MPHLEKYSGQSSRHECPKCHDKKSFTYYLGDDGEPISPICGKCDHENNCGYHYTPKQFYNDNPNQRPKMTNNFKQTIQAQAPKPPCSIPFRYVKRMASYQSAFCRFLYGLFGADILAYLMALYAMGATDRKIIFWQIDISGKVRTGKIMAYKNDGHRNKERFPNWVHSVLGKQGLLGKDWELSQCLFGEHLLSWKMNKGKTVAIVESEKTALICAAVWPQFVWLATGGKNNLQPEKLKVLEGRKIILYPDTDTKGLDDPQSTFNQWSTKAKALPESCQYKVSDLLEKQATPDQKAKGIDIADWIVDEIQSERLKPHLTNEMAAILLAERNPIVGKMISELDLNPDR